MLLSPETSSLVDPLVWYVAIGKVKSWVVLIWMSYWVVRWGAPPAFHSNTMGASTLPWPFHG